MNITRLYKKHCETVKVPCCYGAFYARFIKRWEERAINTENMWHGWNRKSKNNVKDLFEKHQFDWWLNYWQFSNNIRKWLSPEEAIKRTRKLLNN